MIRLRSSAFLILVSLFFGGSLAGCGSGADDSRYWRDDLAYYPDLSRDPGAGGEEEAASGSAVGPAIGCEGWRITYLTGESTLDPALSVTARCEGGQAFLEVLDARDQPVEDCTEVDYECPEQGVEEQRIELSRGQWVALWRSVEGSGWQRTEHGMGPCAPAEREGVPNHSIAITTPSDSRTLFCRQDPLPESFARIVEALTPEPASAREQDEIFWPFDGTYWRDELAYYRAQQSRAP